MGAHCLRRPNAVGGHPLGWLPTGMDADSLANWGFPQRHQ